LRRGVDVIGELLDHVQIFHLEEHVPIGAHAVIAGSDARLGLVRIELVGGDLLLGEAVVGLVIVE